MQVTKLYCDGCCKEIPYPPMLGETMRITFELPDAPTWTVVTHYSGACLRAYVDKLQSGKQFLPSSPCPTSPCPPPSDTRND